MSELKEMTCKQLREEAKELDIQGRWDMTKDQLIEAILGAKKEKETKVEQSAKVEEKVDNQDVVAEVKVENESADVKVDMEQKMHYVEDAAVGALVAFRLSNGKVKSAKIVRKSTKNRKLKLETEYGAEFIISYDDVVWIRTGKRWPKGIYQLLKGLNENGEETEK